MSPGSSVPADSEGPATGGSASEGEEDITGETFESGRLIGFSDGIVAVAITILILPLADIEIPDVKSDTNPLGTIWTGNQPLILSFLVSWLVIMAFWLAHHRIFGAFRAVNQPIIRWNIVWLFAIVVLPFSTNLISQSDQITAADRQITMLYIGIMLTMSVSLALISRQGRLNPHLLKAGSPSPSRGADLRSWLISIYMALVFVVAAIAPRYATICLVGLFAIEPLERRFSSRAATRPPPSPPATSGPGERGDKRH